MGIGLDTPRHSANAGSSIYQFLSANGDGTGTYNWVGDYEDDLPTSSTAQATFVCPPNYIATLHRMMVTIADNGVVTPATYGALAELTNGVHLVVYDDDDSELLHLDAQHPIKTNMDWASFCFDVDINSQGAGNDSYVNARWTFAKSGQPVVLKAGQYLSVNLEDDFTGLDHHHFMVQGVLTKVFNKGT